MTQVLSSWKLTAFLIFTFGILVPASGIAQVNQTFKSKIVGEWAAEKKVFLDGGSKIYTKDTRYTLTLDDDWTAKESMANQTVKYSIEDEFLTLGPVIYKIVELNQNCLVLKKQSQSGDALARLSDFTVYFSRVNSINE